MVILTACEFFLGLSFVFLVWICVWVLIQPKEEPTKYKIFHDHVKAHLKPNGKVICKICGMGVEETFEEWKKKRGQNNE